MRYAAEFAKAGADLYCFHYEAAISSLAAKHPEDHETADRCTPRDLVRYVHELGMHAGIALTPETPVEVLYSILDSEITEEVPDVSVPPDD